MDKEEIKDYLKRVDELELKLTGKDKDTYQWLLFGYNECARLLNEKEQENQQLKEQKKELRSWLEEYKENASNSLDSYDCGIADCLGDVLKKLNELEGKNE